MKQPKPLARDGGTDVPHGPVPAAPDDLNFAHHLMHWQRAHGRHHLPWQRDRDPYKVWLSEIMLQQTQVSTVVDYFERFVVRFPTVEALAQAPLDEVMGLWSGLGYYSRARNLHCCAQQVVSQWQGRFPPLPAQLQQLPGIGRSTAAAIAATCFEQRVSILDGNAKRVIARYLGFTDNVATSANEKRLWALAETLLPPAASPASPPLQTPSPMATYTQGLMDLGATLCTAKSPACDRCPVQSGCQAHRLQLQTAIPLKQKQLKRSHSSYWLLCAQWQSQEGGQTLLQRRPLKGIWAGLLCLPVFDSYDQLIAALPLSLSKAVVVSEPVAHALTHKDLRLFFVSVKVPKGGTAPLARRLNGQWLLDTRWPDEGLPAPVRRWLGVGWCSV
jgi:A/G-specific adenine glycosylase